MSIAPASNVASATSTPPVFPGECLTGEFQLRNPFRCMEMTWLCRTHLLLHRSNASSTLKGFLLRWAQHKAYRSTRSRSNLPKGAASLLVDAQWRDFTFNAANTQFESIYAPDYANGYEPETAVLIDAMLPANGVMYDIGANWGHVSLFAASRPGFHGQVFSFEPMPSTYDDLAATVRQTGMDKIVTTHNLALADHEGTAQMGLPDREQSGLASLTFGGGTSVKVTRLDQLGLPAPSLMKIDVEGHEAQVLKGAEQTIRNHRPVVIFENALAPDISTVLDPFRKLTELGYLFFLPAFVRGDGDTKRYMAQARNGDMKGLVRLALIPFSPLGRWLLPPYSNIFACHADRIGEVTAAFTFSPTKDLPRS